MRNLNGIDVRKEKSDTAFRYALKSGRLYDEQDLTGTVVFILSSRVFIDNKGVHGIFGTFRQVTEWEGEIVTSIVHEPDMSLGSMSTTVTTIEIFSVGWSKFHLIDHSSSYQCIIFVSYLSLSRRFGRIQLGHDYKMVVEV